MTSASLQDVYREVLDIKERMASKDEIESLLETFEILHNTSTMKQVRASDRDIRAGKTRAVRNVRDLLNDLDS